MVYVDCEYKCHTANPEGKFRQVETDFFDGKCQAFVEGYCYDDSRGYGAIYPWKPYAQLAAAQQQYEQMLPQLLDMEAALNTLGVRVDG